jgi:hypothetical protein
VLVRPHTRNYTSWISCYDQIIAAAAAAAAARDYFKEERLVPKNGCIIRAARIRWFFEPINLENATSFGKKSNNIIGPEEP